MHTFPPLDHSDVSMSRHAHFGDKNVERHMVCNTSNRKGDGQRSSPTHETRERHLRSVAHDSMAVSVLTKIRNHPNAKNLTLRDSGKTLLRRQPHEKAQQSGSADPSFLCLPHKKRDDTSHSGCTPLQQNNQTMMMISPTISIANMKHNDHSLWEDSTRTTRPRSRAIAIKQSQRQDSGDDDFPDYSDQAARMYDDSTWAMYLRIVEYRQKHPMSSSSNDQAGAELSMNQLNDDHILRGTGRSLHGNDDPRGVNFYDTDEEEIFDMEL